MAAMHVPVHLHCTCKGQADSHVECFSCRSLPGTGFSDKSQDEMSAGAGSNHQATLADDHYHAGDIDIDQNVEYKGLDDTLRPSIDRMSSPLSDVIKCICH